MSSGGTSPAAEHKESSGEAPGGKLFLTRAAESVGRGIKNIAVGIWNRVWGVAEAGVKATVAQPFAEAGELGQRFGAEPLKEVGLFSKLAEIIERTNKGVTKVLRWPVDIAVTAADFATGIPGRVAGRGLRAVQDAWNVILGRPNDSAPAVHAENQSNGHEAPAHA